MQALRPHIGAWKNVVVLALPHLTPQLLAPVSVAMITPGRSWAQYSF